jgi:hypothetical protein
MNTKTAIGLLSLLVVITLTGCGKSKNDFAPQLAEDIIDTWSKGAEKNKGKEMSFFSSEDYNDIGRGISLHRKGMDLTQGLGGLVGAILGGGKEEPGQESGLAEQIATRAELLRKGYDVGLDMGGYIDLKDYDTGFGDLENQQLGWGFSSTSQLVTCHIKGTVLNDDKKPIEVDYTFQVDNDSNGLSSSTIKMLGGTIKDGDDITKVPID